MKRIYFKMMQWMMFLLAFLSFIPPGLGETVYQLTAYVSGTAEFRCHFENSNIISISELIYNWEKQSRIEHQHNHVVAEFYMGQKKDTHVSESYKNRFMEFMTNGDLRMFNITLEDEGVYYCYVRQKTKNMNIIHITENKLNVLANFTVPQFSNERLQEVAVNSTVDFHCSSTDGFPNPHEMLWVVSYENGTQFYRPPYDIKKNSQTFNISSDLAVTVKSNISITCTVLAHHNFTSEILHIVVKSIPKVVEKKDHLKYVLPCSILVACVIACFIYLCYWRKGKSCKSRSSANERVTPTTAATDNGAAQQREETTLFITDKVEVNVS